MLAQVLRSRAEGGREDDPPLDAHGRSDGLQRATEGWMDRQ
jgi:hypothetical protein